MNIYTPRKGHLYSAPYPPSDTEVRLKVWISLTEAAQHHVVRNGLRNRFAFLTEQADQFERIMQTGDRVALSDSPNHDLYVLRRRVVVDTRESALEIVLDILPGI